MNVTKAKMRKKSFILAALALFILSLVSCGGPEIEKTQTRSRASLKGTFLTESPDEINFPVKVLFAIDYSLSMGDMVGDVKAGSDPYFLRVQAVRDFIGKYNNDNENVSFEIMLWSSAIFGATRTIDGDRGFTKDTEQLNGVLDETNVDTTTNYLRALEAIRTDIQNDISLSSDAELVRTKYIVVFLSDGMPNVGLGGGEGGAVTQPDSEIWSSVEDMAQMVEDSGAGSFSLHTFLLLGGFASGEDGNAAREHAEETLQGMSSHGNGQFRNFENAESIDFIDVVDMRLTFEYKIKYLVAYNYNVRPGLELVYIDSDGDGLTDDEEIAYGSDPLMKDSDGDRMSDFFERKVSSPGNKLDPNVQDSNCDEIAIGDTDNDGLTNCEEYMKGTDRRVADTDSDGIPDGIEFMAGTNPLEDQMTKDSDFDGTVDWLEVQKHTNVTSNDPKIRSRYAYNYNIIDQGLVPIDQGTEMESYVRQFRFDISNIDLMNTAAFITPSGEQWNEGDNLIRFYIAQIPEDRPNMSPLFRMAEVIVNINDPDLNIMLTPADFTLIQ